MTPAQKCNLRRKSGLDCSKKLFAAAESLRKYLSACREMEDGSGDEKRGISDSRIVMARDLDEYAAFLQRIYEDKP